MASISRRKFLQLTSAASVAAAAGSLPVIARASAPVSLRFSSSMVADPNASHYVWYQNFAANLKANLGDAIHVDYFPNNQLGKESDVVQQVKIGSIDMMVTGVSIWATLAPEIGMLDMGYLFDSFAHAEKVLDGHVGAALNKCLQDRSGCQILTWTSQFGARNVFTKKPVRSLAEFKGTKIRVLPTPAFIETFKAMGAVPTPIPFGELYMAAQTGVVDGLEHDSATVLSGKFYEVVKSCWKTQHNFSPLVVVIGKRSMDKIPAELRPGFFKAIKDASLKQRPIADEKVTQAEQALKERGMTFYPMASAERDAVRSQLQGTLYQSFAKQYPVTAPLFSEIAAAKA
ncbi:TRAP transporter substrate-binding protein [Paraburkholderia gardini]|uniref:2,3-diketo-L-gulonate-binding periplasmic protein YiaO n=1 Tax=Paraburkholderia gardini TaxID=2823469 RepID=A0ABM8TX97_9BURK|nr:TRAP transporter substrate-binding protein [Paraburkholderia gardini]CAG4885813.1 2,3-diketo-L-gulonate-binding periplasmic protein YiaO [Paraburkholderia gardini]CAG4911895.1 2,3-diketo-L-gulonate-binding periplasmic protein YiaO [Paraburkholderia gardini]